MTQKEKAKLVPVSREPALLTERDADKSPVLWAPCWAACSA